MTDPAPSEVPSRRRSWLPGAVACALLASLAYPVATVPPAQALGPLVLALLLGAGLRGLLSAPPVRVTFLGGLGEIG
ncbi:MAG: hypothetical protein WD336_11060, partial [Trueperaceae bacterium]